jgi:hypothetical protein
MRRPWPRLGRSTIGQIQICNLGAFCTFKIYDCFKVSVYRWIVEVNIPKYRAGAAIANSILSRMTLNRTKHSVSGLRLYMT